MTPAELESLMARELAKLPRLRAPEALLPRIVAAVGQLQVVPWHRRGWRAWPIAFKFAVAALCALFAWFAPQAVTAAEAAIAPEVAVTGAALWRHLLQPAAPYLAAIVAALVVANATFLAALRFMLREGGTNHEAF